SILETTRIGKLLQQHQVETVYHAAAYKHVPLVEMNPLEGFRNNVLGTQSLLEACQAHQPESFVLISTDKTVRPTNLMSASNCTEKRPDATLWLLIHYLLRIVLENQTSNKDRAARVGSCFP
ncbi:MAG: polysaccharide biosynthesis protein, partial [Deltaproteobacteria bacterium]